ncbi:protein kinase [Endozoicomonas sp. GU-1]|uniref:protein kinase domain-containing protein n=1 Tax=Endozoicomonas sp. GU-1 TaxID=3009078 RepID=UPI0022B455C6|nr:protein kinase [Endozoicomonas sp. GU-1]WBA80642.1 protein kinase [Endozoicomonas sp. GU-1]WBA88207.1 protein kinase [Endozoicomonas sp. GU-1]
MQSVNPSESTHPHPPQAHFDENNETVALMSGRYIKKHQIGEGCFSKVFLAEKITGNTENKYVALKKTSHYGEIEINAFKALNPHANIVTMLDHSLDSSTIAMELADCNVYQLIGLWGQDKTKLNSKQLNFFIAELLRGYLHILQKGRIISADIGKKNVLYVARENRLKISDFGRPNNSNDPLIWNRRQQKKIGELLLSLLDMMGHDCVGVPPGHKHCSDCLQHEIRICREGPNKSLKRLKQELSNEQEKIISDLLNARLDSGQIENILESLTTQLEILPKPEKFSDPLRA